MCGERVRFDLIAIEMDATGGYQLRHYLGFM
jgi:hypothetical protein